MDRSWRLWPLAWGLVLLAAGCAARTSYVDTQLRALIADHHLTGDPSVGRDLPGIEEPLAQLGKQLFFAQSLSGDGDAACVSCHHPLLGGGDALTLSIGVGANVPGLLGPGRRHVTGAPNVGRNAPTTFNSALWDQVQFHDGRLESLDKLPGRNGNGSLGIRTPDTLPGMIDPLAGSDLVTAQSRFPLISPAEMRGYDYAAHQPSLILRERLAARLGGFGLGAGELGQTQWPRAFERVFGPAARVEDLVTEQRIAAAIGAYERSQVFVNTPWRAYVAGDTQALSREAKQGALLFFRTVEAGGAGCATCHSGDYFTDEQFYTLAIPQVGPGKSDDPYVDDPAVQAPDFGRWYASFDEADRFAFRTPTLLNVTVTGPYGHDGAYATLEGVVRHHLHPARAVADYDVTQLDPGVQTARMVELTAPALAKLAQDQQAERTTLQDVDLSRRQVAQLLAFLAALTDPCVQDAACLAPWLPAPGEFDPDGQRLVVHFSPGVTP